MVHLNAIGQWAALAALLLLACAAAGAQAGQGCPFDDGSCQEYCGQQGCKLGYCGHFAWIQCICRKCGNEWNWHDQVRYNPDKTVNQTELDSLKLNMSQPIVLSASAEQAKPSPAGASTKLTTLLIPDLGEGGKLDANDIPDENSDKFIDYLARNHERLVQSAAGGPDEQEEQEEPASTAAPPADSDELVEIQISSSDNATTASSPPAPPAPQQPQPQPNLSRLLRVAVSERSADEID